MLFEFFNKMMERIQSDCFDFSTAREKLKQEDQSSGSRQWWFESEFRVNLIFQFFFIF